ncbi:MAG: glycosyltransferase family 2 protein, partial [Bacteroidota bacterium]
PKAIFQQIQFDESLKQYGHEDTLFGIELKVRQIPILHLDNPLEHIGLEETEVFLAKTEQAIQNLAQLYKQGKAIETKLLSTYLILKKYKLRNIFLFCYRIFELPIKQNLRSLKPQLLYFDLYKLNQLTKYLTVYSY